ncbi:hypothetical protein [Paeniglutamicibacter psychrophenolicus]|uniref:hypothetical protein n=1 Tax=Paeniglutamicibacter psychrophenolicus TaxID=257454 RepID=UPI00277F9241|nr:hypothetical protein [Paeniglutamicibacter psychrophenolicus]MDQ0096155.1 hypothetical protein [Paeniglutamicibacter psychrophenolicus]
MLKTKAPFRLLGMAIAGALLLTSCAAVAGTPAPNNASASASAEKTKSPIELVREADPDRIGPGLAYSELSKNAAGPYVRIGVDKDSALGKFDNARWTATGKNWTEADLAQGQLAAVDFVYAELFSGTTVGGNTSDVKAQVTRMTKLFGKDARKAGIEEQLNGLFEQPVSKNMVVAWTDPATNNFQGYDFYQSKDSSRFMNPQVTIAKASAYDEGSTVDSQKAGIDGATVTVVAKFDWKFSKGKKRFLKPTEIEYDVYLIKTDEGVRIHGVGLQRGEIGAAPEESTKF